MRREPPQVVNPAPDDAELSEIVDDFNQTLRYTADQFAPKKEDLTIIRLLTLIAARLGDGY